MNKEVLLQNQKSIVKATKMYRYMGVIKWRQI